MDQELLDAVRNLLDACEPFTGFDHIEEARLEVAMEKVRLLIPPREDD